MVFLVKFQRYHYAAIQEQEITADSAQEAAAIIFKLHPAAFMAKPVEITDESPVK